MCLCLQASSGQPWQKRAPAWASMGRVVNALVMRSSQAAFRGWARQGLPELATAVQVPSSYRNLLLCMSRLALHASKDVRDEAVRCIDTVVKRFPVMAPILLPMFMAVLAGLEPESAYPTMATGSGSAGEGAVLEVVDVGILCSRLRHLVSTSSSTGSSSGAESATGASTAAAAAAAGGVGAVASTIAAAMGSIALSGDTSKDTKAAALAAAAVAEAVASGGVGGGASGTETERHGRVLGACSMISQCLSFWRAIFRCPLLLDAMMHALLASRVHDATVPQAAIAQLFMAMEGRFIQPPTLDSSTEQYREVLSSIMAMARPGGPGRSGPWRYSLYANVLTVLLLPPPPKALLPSPDPSPVPQGGAVQPSGMQPAVHTAQLLQLLGADMPQLRAIALAGLHYQLAGVLEHRIPAEGVLDVVVSGVSGDGFGASLMRCLVLGHTTLDQQEGMKDKR